MARIDEKGNFISDVSTYTTIDSEGNLQHIPMPTRKKKKKENEWFDTGAFDDGYDFGDVTKTILGTAVNIPVNIAKGAADLGKGIGHLGAAGVAQIADWAGNDEWANQIRENISGKNEKYNELEKNLTLPGLLTQAQETTSKDSVLAKNTESILQGAGNYAGMAAAQAVGVPWQLTAGLSAAGSELSNAYANGAEDWEAWTSAAGNAAFEILSEYISGGAKLPGTGKTMEKLSGNLVDSIKNKYIKGLAGFGINMLGEGIEENVSGIASEMLRKLTYMKDDEKSLLANAFQGATDYLSQEALNDFIGGAVVAGLTMGVSPGTYQNIKTGRNLVSGLTSNEQKTIDELVDKRYNEAVENGEKVSKSKIEEQVKKDLEKGYIDLEEIEKSLGGDTYTQYQEAQQREESIQKEIDKLENMKITDMTVKQQEELKSLREELSNQTNTVENLGKQLRSYVNELTQNDTLLRNSYNEYANKGNAYNVDLSQVKESQRDTYQRAIDSGVLNNTNRSHDFLDLIAKLEEEKGVKFDFTNNEKLKDTRFALDGKQVNGYIDGNNIVLNMDTDKALNSVIGHEITHVLEGTDLYESLQNAVKEYATTKGEYEVKLNDLKELYKEVKDANIERELTADFIGDYLFTDEEFVKRLSTQNRNLFEKIYDEIKYLAKLITTGSKEGRQLEKIKHTFEKVYRQQNTNIPSNTKYKVTNDNGEPITFLRYQKNAMDMSDDFDYNQSDVSHKTGFGINFSDSDMYTKGKDSKDVLKTTITSKKGLLTDTNTKVPKKQIDALNEVFNKYIPDVTMFSDNITDGQLIDQINTASELIANAEDNNTGRKAYVEFYNVINKDGYIRTEPDGSKLLSVLSKESIDTFNNTNTKRDQNVKYSVSEDNQGRKLSKQQQEYFKDSKVRDENGNLLRMYHGTPKKGFNIFDVGKINYANAYGSGFYFTSNKSLASNYNNFGKGKIFETYLNIKNPIEVGYGENRGISKEKLKNIVENLSDNEVNDYWNRKDVYYPTEKIAREKLLEELNNEKSDQVLLNNIKNIYGNNQKFIDNFKSVTGYDGIKASDGFYVVFDSNQIKNIDNANPTTNEDIRYSISNQNEDIAPIGNYQIKGEDIKLQDIAPIEKPQQEEKETKPKKEIPINPTKEEAYETKKTRAKVREELSEEMGITTDDLEFGKDISSLGYQRTDPIRLNEKVFGAKIGKKINDATIRKTNHNEAERTRFLNKEREEIKNLGIKARSKESAAVQKYGEKQYVNEHGEVVPYTDADLAREFPNVETQNKIKNAAKVLRGKYDTYIDDINKVITEMGYDAIPKRPDYMRHFQEINDKLSEWGVPLNRDSLSKDTLPTDINGVTDQFKPGKNWFASAMQRKGLKTTYDAITGIDGYLEGASNLIYHTADIQRYRTLSKLIRDTYGQTHGLDNIDLNTKEGQNRLNNIMDNKLSKYAAWLDEQANALAGKKGGIDRAAERLLGRKIYTIADTAKKQVGSNMTGFNVRSALTNFASAVQGASKTNKLAFIKGTISTVKNIIHNDGLIDKSDFLTNRFGSDTLSKKLWQKVSNAGQIFMTGTDYFTANQIWRSKYYENLSKGMNETEAIKNADDFASRIMGDRSKGMAAEIFNSKTLGLLTQFQLEVNNQWSSIMHDNKMDVKSGNKSGAMVMFQLGQLAAMSYMFNNFMKSMTGSDVMIDPIDMLKELFGWNDDDEETTLEQRAQKVLGDVVNDLPFASFMTGGRIPIAEAFTGVGTAFNKLTGQKDKYGNDITWDDVKDDAISSAAYWLLPTGYGQLKKTAKGLSMYDESLPLPGSYTNSGNLRFTGDDSAGGMIKAALFGEYSSEEAQKYRENYETINANDVDMLKELNMNSSQFKQFKNKMDEATETSIKKDGVKYTKYFDANNNEYWYDKESKKLYDEDFRESNKNVLDLKKASNNELLYDYISKLQLEEKQKQMLFNKYFTNATTDQYGYEKYKDSKGKTYWYNKDKGILYDSKYNSVIDKSVNELQKVTETKDMTDYKKYGSYEEADFAIKNPDKYLTSRVVSNNFDTYKKYTQDISNITGDKDAKDKTIPNSKKKKVVDYIDNLNEDYGSKIILYKMYYPKDNSYNYDIVDYLNNLDRITLDEEKQILSYLGMKITDDGTVRW